MPLRRRLLLLLSLLAAALMALPMHASADAPKRVFMAPDDHTDYMWSATAAQYEGFFVDMLDYYLDQADATAAEPSQFQSRFSADGSLWLRAYQRNRTPGQFQRLVDALKSGHISAPMNPLVLTYGGIPAEAVIRSMYYAGQLERRYGVDFPLASAVENAGMPYGLGALWAGAGARYSWNGVCNCHSLIPNLGNREAEVYNWIGPDGSSVLMKWYSLLDPDENRSIGGYAEARFPATALDLVTSNAVANGFAARYPYDTIGVFGQGWDDLYTKNLTIQQTCKAMTDTTRTCIVSDMVDFFDEFQALYGNIIPSLSASYGNEWDLSPASLAEVSAHVKRSLEKLRAAEALATLVALKNPSFLDGRDVARDQAFLDFGLFFEHDFENGGPNVSGAERIAWQRDVATEIESYANSLLTDASRALGALIQRSGTNPRFFAFNPLSWTRTDVADVPYTGALPVHVIDLTTGLEVPSQVVTIGGSQYLRVEVPGIPSVGYKAFEIQPGAGEAFTGGPTANASSGVMENDYYRLTVSPRGAITSFVDKRQNNRQVAGATGGFGINDLGPGGGSLTVENAGPVAVTLRATSGSPLAHTTRITLVRGSDRVAIDDEITENFGGTVEWRFSLNAANPQVRHEEVGAIPLAKLTTQGGSYAARNARYDYLTLNHFADMTGSDGTGVTLSNADAYFMHLGNSSASSLDTTTPQLSVVAGSSARTSNPILSQAGDAYLLQRFALQSHGPYDQPAAMRFALEHQDPLVTGTVSGGTAYPETTYSYLTISDPDVLLWSLKPSDEGIGEGVIARVWNLAPTPRPFSLSLNEPIAAAKAVTHIETDQGSATLSGGALTATTAQNQLLSFRLFPSSLPPAVQILPTEARLTEAGHAGSFTIVRTGDTAAPLDVPYTIAGSATAVGDYQPLSGTATIPAGASSTVVPLVPLADSYAEPDETITVTLTPQPAYLLGLWRSATATLMANGGPGPPPGSLVAAYSFGEGGGTTTADVSGNGNTGTITAATWTAGKYGQGLLFNGSTSFVTAPDASSLDLGSIGTVEAWVRLDALGVWHGIVAKGNANSLTAHNYGLEVTNANKVECGIGNGGSSNAVVSTTALTAGAMYHLACVWTGTQLQLYINAARNASTSQTITPAGNTAALNIGEYGGGVDRTKGVIDEVRIYNRALTQAELQTDMDTPVAPPTPDAVPPTVSITAPAGGASVAGRVTVKADASDNVGVAGVQFTVDGMNYGPEDAASPYAVDWDTTAWGNGSHILSATARDAAGNTATAADVAIAVDNDKTPPTIPANLSAVASSSSQINVSWTASTDDVAVTGYRVTRNGAVVRTTTGTSFTDTGLASLTTYVYSVAAYDAANNFSAESSPASATTPAAPSALVAAYGFGEGAGTTTADSSLNGNGGTLMNGAAWTALGKYGNAISFDGIDDHVRVADSASLGLTWTGTVEAWAKFNTLNRRHSVVAKGNASLDRSHDYAIEVDKSNKWRCILGNGISAITLRSSTGPKTGQFYHVACVWNGSVVQLFVNGVLNVSTVQSLMPAVNSSPLYIGQFGGDADRLKGVIDEVRIYNRALTQAEVRADMNRPL